MRTCDGEKQGHWLSLESLTTFFLFNPITFISIDFKMNELTNKRK